MISHCQKNNWNKIITEIAVAPKIAGNPNARPLVQVTEARKTTEARFQINNANLSVTVVTLCIKW